MTAEDEPGDGALHHGAPAPVVIEDLALTPSAPGLDQLGVVAVDAENPAVLASAILPLGLAAQRAFGVGGAKKHYAEGS